MTHDLNVRHHGISSDHLRSLREFLLGLPHMASAMGELQQLRIVLDSNIVLGDLIWLAKHRTNPSARTSLQEVVASGTVIAFAPMELRVQVEKHLPRVATQENIPKESLFEEWRNYQSYLNFCQAEPDQNIQLVNPERDPTDLPFIYLVSNIGAAAVLTKDKDLSAMGAPTAQVTIMIHLRDFARGKAVELTILMGSTTVVTGISIGIFKLVTSLARGFTQLPDPMKLFLILVTVFVVLHSKSRKTLFELANQGWGKIKPALSQMSETYITERQKAVCSWETAKRSLPPHRKIPLQTHAYAACHAAKRPLTLQELDQKIRIGGYKPRGRNPIPYLKKVLRGDGRFMRCSDGQWTITSFSSSDVLLGLE